MNHLPDPRQRRVGFSSLPQAQSFSSQQPVMQQPQVRGTSLDELFSDQLRTQQQYAFLPDEANKIVMWDGRPVYKEYTTLDWTMNPVKVVEFSKTDDGVPYTEGRLTKGTIFQCPGCGRDMHLSEKQHCGKGHIVCSACSEVYEDRQRWCKEHAPKISALGKWLEGFLGLPPGDQDEHKHLPEQTARPGTDESLDE